MESGDERDAQGEDALGQAPDATVTSEELRARKRLSRGWAMIAGAAVVFVAAVLLIGWLL